MKVMLLLLISILLKPLWSECLCMMGRIGSGFQRTKCKYVGGRNESEKVVILVENLDQKKNLTRIHYFRSYRIGKVKSRGERQPKEQSKNNHLKLGPTYQKQLFYLGCSSYNF